VSEVAGKRHTLLRGERFQDDLAQALAVLLVKHLPQRGKSTLCLRSADEYEEDGHLARER
jgi:hypothetical protein